MWSDRPGQERLRQLVAGLHSVLPAASHWAAVPGIKTTPRPGFAWFGSRFFNAPLATVTYWGGHASVSGPQGKHDLHACGFELLEAMLEAWRGAPGAVLAGFLSYDLAAELEDLGPVSSTQLNFPKFYFALYPCESASPQIKDVPTIAPLGSQGPITSRPDRTAFQGAVQRTVERIRAGEIFQTNLCRSIEVPLERGMEWELYCRMRTVSPARYQSFFQIDQHRAVLSISPEMFLKVEGGVVESSPIKGTRPRGCSPAEDEALLAELRSSEKDRAELAMIVDVVRNDLGRVCQTGSVKVVQHAESMSLPTVHHLFSTVLGRLREDAGLVDLLRAAFPAASISGAPKIEAMRVAAREEGQLRGPCMGAIGWMSFDRRMEFSVAIRTAFTVDGKVRYYAGCGITSDSIPANEFEESRHKAAAFVRALRREDDPNW